MSESPVYYDTYTCEPTCDIMEPSADMDTVRAHLVDLERQLISLLVTVQRAQGKEPTVMTKAMRRGRQ